MPWGASCKNEHIGEIGFLREKETQSIEREVRKGVWGMPRLSEAKKDVISCEKLRGSANTN